VNILPLLVSVLSRCLSSTLFFLSPSLSVREGAGKLPQRAGQFPSDKKVDRGGRYVGEISHAVNIYLS